ncbi:hypothetical protein [Flavobacterium sp. FlaQc-48]|uniref:hypothetical protein n=1 Tax=Flavobacterium sp. FlaQc-48 TaxID=3374181 RepID=UPI003757BE76
MKTIIKIITIILLVLSNNSTRAQTPITRDYLKSRTWILNEGLKATMQITDTEIIYYINDEFLTSEKYYISDKSCTEESFDLAKVGLISTGNYIHYEKSSCVYIEFVNSSAFKKRYSDPISSDWSLIEAKP